MSFTVNPEPNDSDTTPTSDPVEDQPTKTDPTTEPDVETPTDPDKTEPTAPTPFTESDPAKFDDTEDDELAFGTESDDEDDESKYDGQGPLKTTDQVDHLYSYEIDERKKADQTGVYYDDLKLMEAEQHRARVEKREPDYDNMAGIASTPLLRMTERAPDEYHS